MIYHRFLNGFYPQAQADLLTCSGEEYLGQIAIPCLGSQEFTDQYVTFAVDILNIDIETIEPDVLGAWNWERCRPKIICAEILSGHIEDMLQSEVARLLRQTGYTAMSRGYQSSVFSRMSKFELSSFPAYASLCCGQQLIRLKRQAQRAA